MRRAKGLSKGKKKELMDKDNSMVIVRGKGGGGEEREGKGGINADGRRLDLGW